MNNYQRIKEDLGYQNDRQFRDALIAADINPKQAELRGLSETQVQKIPRITRALAASEAQQETAETERPGVEPTVSIEQVQRKLGVDPETMVALCREFGLSENRPLAQSEAMALCELAIEVYGGQLEQELDFVDDRQALLFQQQQSNAYQLGYLEESTLDAARMNGRLKARQKRLGKQEREVRRGQEQVFSLLSKAGKSVKPKSAGTTANQAHEAFALELWL